MLRMLTISLVALGSALIAHTPRTNEIDQLAELALLAQRPEEELANLGLLEILGNASLDDAQILFLPEVHDDPKSLMAQILLLAREQTKGRPFIVLDESMPAHKKGVWDVFTQKALEVIAARQKRAQGEHYSPRKFEATLRELVGSLKKSPGELLFDKPEGIWYAKEFAPFRLPFYGWDLEIRNSLVDRNTSLVKTLASHQGKERILVLLGARHVPDLEYLTSQKLMCPNSMENADEFFMSITEKFGALPRLGNGIGSTTPTHAYLKDKSYAVVFLNSMYSELDRIVDNMASFNNHECINVINN